MLTAAAARVMSFAPGGEMILLLEFLLNGNLDKITTRLPGIKSCYWSEDKRVTHALCKLVQGAVQVISGDLLES
jgi:hypothetical protein